MVHELGNGKVNKHERRSRWFVNHNENYVIHQRCMGSSDEERIGLMHRSVCWKLPSFHIPLCQGKWWRFASGWFPSSSWILCHASRTTQEKSSTSLKNTDPSEYFTYWGLMRKFHSPINRNSHRKFCSHFTEKQYPNPSDEKWSSGERRRKFHLCSSNSAKLFSSRLLIICWINHWIWQLIVHLQLSSWER